MSDYASITTQVKTYLPNTYGVYNLFGNAAEIVQTDSAFYAVGGSWNDYLKDFTLNNKIVLNDGFTGAKTIGFRPILRIKTKWYLSNFLLRS